MSKILSLIFIVLSLISFLSCGEEPSILIVEKIEKLNKSISNNFETMSESDWDASIQSFENYKNDFERQKSEMSNEDRSRYNKAIGRFEALSSKRYIGDLKDGLKDYSEQAESYVKEFFD